MKRLILPPLVLLLAIPHAGQTAAPKAGGYVADEEKNGIIVDLQALESKLVKLEKPLALALAKAEIADATWWVERERAKVLLREAYELTFPDDEEQKRLREQPVGTLPLPTGEGRARFEVRNRILHIAGRDKELAEHLAQLGAKQLGKHDEHLGYAKLASKAIAEGNKEEAGRYILQSVEADPTLITAGFIILDLAAQDRAAADRLIIQYIERLRNATVPFTEQSALRVYFILSGLLFPSPVSDRQRRQIPPAGAEAVRAYVSYVVESVGKFERSEPGSAQRFRGFLLSVWQPLRQYAPDLEGAFLELERVSRRPGESAALPATSGEEASKDRYEKRLRDALHGERPDDSVINSAISREEFDKARKMIDKLDDGPHRAYLTEVVNAAEAISLAKKGDIWGAERKAERLSRATSILRVYPAIIERCAARKDQACASNLVYQAVKKLKLAEAAPNPRPDGLPSYASPTSRELDPVLLGLSRLAAAVIPADAALAFEIAEEIVVAANRSEMDTGLGRTGFDVEVFKKLAPKNEPRARQAAEGFKDPLRQTVALAAIYQWKAERFAKKGRLIGERPLQ